MEPSINFPVPPECSSENAARFSTEDSYGILPEVLPDISRISSITLRLGRNFGRNFSSTLANASSKFFKEIRSGFLPMFHLEYNQDFYIA